MQPIYEHNTPADTSTFKRPFICTSVVSRLSPIYTWGGEIEEMVGSIHSVAGRPFPPRPRIVFLHVGYRPTGFCYLWRVARASSLGAFSLGRYQRTRRFKV